jgi:hypothetical protein
VSAIVNTKKHKICDSYSYPCCWASKYRNHCTEGSGTRIFPIRHCTQGLVNIIYSVCSKNNVVLVENMDVLTLFLVEHMNVLNRAVIRNQLAETPSTGQSNRLGQERRRKPRFPAPGGTPSGTVRLGLS